MKEYINEMLELTAEIADRLLILKDSGNEIDPQLNLLIQQLAVISDRETMAVHNMEGMAEDTNTPSQSEKTEYTAEQSIGMSAEYEEAEDADVQPEEQNQAVEEPTSDEAVITADEAVESTSQPTEEESEPEAIEDIKEREETEEPEVVEEVVETAEEAEPQEEPAMVIIVDDDEETPVEIYREEESEPETEPIPEEATTAEELTAEAAEDEEVADANVAEVEVEDKPEAPKEEPEQTQPKEPERNVVEQSHRARMDVGMLRKAFSLNDTFFYRRTLFGGSQAQFNEALEYAAECNGTADLTRYLAENLGIDTESEAAQEFIGVLASFL